jgi:hypothetical protein
MLTLPKDVVFYMSQWLMFRDVLRLRQVCKQLRALSWESNPIFDRSKEKISGRYSTTPWTIDAVRKLQCCVCYRFYYTGCEWHHWMKFTNDEPGVLCVKCHIETYPDKFIEIPHDRWEVFAAMGAAVRWLHAHKIEALDVIATYFETPHSVMILKRLQKDNWAIMSRTDWEQRIRDWLLHGDDEEERKRKTSLKLT